MVALNEQGALGLSSKVFLRLSPLYILELLVGRVWPIPEIASNYLSCFLLQSAWLLFDGAMLYSTMASLAPTSDVLLFWSNWKNI